MTDSQARTLYDNDVTLAKEIDEMRGAYGQRIAELERQIILLNNLLMSQQRRAANIVNTLESGVHNELTSAAAGREIATVASQMQNPTCASCAS